MHFFNFQHLLQLFEFFKFQKMARTDRGVPFEIICAGFWKYFAGVVRRITPVQHMYNLNYALFALFTAVAELLICSPDMVTRCAAEVLRHIVQVDIAKGMALGMSYNPGTRAEAIDSRSMIRKIQGLGLIGMIHIREQDPDSPPNYHNCSDATNEQMKQLLRGILQFLEERTNLTPRQLAIAVQIRHDRAQYDFDVSQHQGLEFLDVIYHARPPLPTLPACP